MMTKTHATLCKDLQDDAIHSRNSLSEAITGNENFVYVYASETKQPYLCLFTRSKAAVIPLEEAIISMPKSSKAVQVKLQKHVVFFDSEGMLHKEFILPCQAVNQQFYIGFQSHLRRLSGENVQTIGTLRMGFCIMRVCLPTHLHLLSSF
jgi:hypothetical protein